MPQLVIFRHGQSVWNLENRFTGWVDVELTDKGIQEAKEAGKKLNNFKLDYGYVSEFRRTKESLMIALKECCQENIPVVFSRELNERRYGDLQGLNKSDTAEKYGAEQVRLWRRSYDVAPPKGESLKDAASRIIPYFEKEIKPKLSIGKNIVISAHGNTMRSIIMFLENLSPGQISQLEFSTGEMRLYEFYNNMSIKNITNL
jgi:2,3-bisphosphoglycerate-dependent phosphoglycerate mutase